MLVEKPNQHSKAHTFMAPKYVPCLNLGWFALQSCEAFVDFPCTFGSLHLFSFFEKVLVLYACQIHLLAYEHTN